MRILGAILTASLLLSAACGDREVPAEVLAARLEKQREVATAELSPAMHALHTTLRPRVERLAVAWEFNRESEANALEVEIQEQVAQVKDPWGGPVVAKFRRAEGSGIPHRIVVIAEYGSRGPGGKLPLDVRHAYWVSPTLVDAGKRLARQLPPKPDRDDLELVTIRSLVKKLIGSQHLVRERWNIGVLKRVEVSELMSRPGKVWFTTHVGRRDPIPETVIPVPGSNYNVRLRADLVMGKPGTYKHADQTEDTVRAWRKLTGEPIWGIVRTDKQNNWLGDRVVWHKSGDLLVQVEMEYEILPLTQQGDGASAK